MNSIDLIVILMLFQRPPIGLIIIPPSMPKLVPYDYTRPGVSFAAAASSSQPTSAPPQPMIRRNRRVGFRYILLFVVLWIFGTY
jgi:hypothetical protein